ncbi:MAG: DUF58 domain-containing protein, partial [Myxococcota bacterium]|nr:DUF58 domain-containing protein [Myxococcota bacterium]
PGGETRLADAVKAFVHQAPRRGLAVLLSDLYSQDGVEDAVNALRYHRFEPLVIHLTDTRELDLTLRGDLQLVDCETGEVREITVTPRLLARYRQAHETWRSGIEAFCTERHVPYLEAPIQLSFDEVVLRLFRAGGFLR